MGDFCHSDDDCGSGLLCTATGGSRGVCTYPGGTPDLMVEVDQKLPDMEQQDMPLMDSRLPDTRPDSLQPDAVTPDAAPPDAIIPDATKPDSLQPDAGVDSGSAG